MEAWDGECHAYVHQRNTDHPPSHPPAFHSWTPKPTVPSCLGFCSNSYRQSTPCNIITMWICDCSPPQILKSRLQNDFTVFPVYKVVADAWFDKVAVLKLCGLPWWATANRAHMRMHLPKITTFLGKQSGFQKQKAKGPEQIAQMETLRRVTPTSGRWRVSPHWLRSFKPAQWQTFFHCPPWNVPKPHYANSRGIELHACTQAGTSACLINHWNPPCRSLSNKQHLCLEPEGKIRAKWWK